MLIRAITGFLPLALVMAASIGVATPEASAHSRAWLRAQSLGGKFQLHGQVQPKVRFHHHGHRFHRPHTNYYDLYQVPRSHHRFDRVDRFHRFDRFDRRGGRWDRFDRCDDRRGGRGRR